MAAYYYAVGRQPIRGSSTERHMDGGREGSATGNPSYVTMHVTVQVHLADTYTTTPTGEIRVL